MTSTVFIIILNWNGRENTIECLESIGRLEVKGFNLEIIVVDNASSDKSVESIKYYISSIKNNNINILENGENLGFAGGNNIGIKYALEHGADYILILNNDTLVDKQLIENLLKEAAKDEEVGIVAPKIYFAKGYEFHKDRYKRENMGKVIWYAGGIMDWKNVLGRHRGVDEVDNGQYDKSELTDFASGCCMLIKREAVEKVGMFDEQFFLYYEDADLSQRVRRAGFAIIFAPKAKLWHKNAGSVGGSGSALQDYFISRNRLIFGMRYVQFRTKISLLRESIRLLFVGRYWQKKGIADFYLNKLGKGSYKI